MKMTLGLAAAALLVGVSFAAAESPSRSPQAPTSVQQPKESGQNEERNPSGATGGSVAHPSPNANAMKSGAMGSSKMGSSKMGSSKKAKKSAKKKSKRSTSGSTMGPRTGQPIETGQAAERNPNGSTGGSVRRPSPQ